MDLMNFIERMREFREREGYLPSSGEPGAASKGTRRTSRQRPTSPPGHDSCPAAAGGRGSEARHKSGERASPRGPRGGRG
jgi:hypothetical protein